MSNTEFRSTMLGLMAILLMATPAHAENDPSVSGAKPEVHEMNGIRLKDYKEFEKKWRQVTVRFRAVGRWCLSRGALARSPRPF
jgi:hypothetical protein